MNSDVVAIMAVVISLISLAISTLDFYLRRRDQKPRITVLASEQISYPLYDEGEVQRDVYITLLNTGGTSVFVIKVILDMECIKKRGVRRQVNASLPSNTLIHPKYVRLCST